MFILYSKWYYRLGGSSAGRAAQICTMQVGLNRYCSVKGESNGQSIGPPVSDAIVRSWLWSTATGSCPSDYFSSITSSRI